MKIITNIVAALLGLFFVYAGLNFFFQWQVPPSPPAGSPAANFIGAMYGSGYLKFVKILEVIGGLLLLVPCLRNWGLVVTGAIAVNIACFHQFFFGGIKDPAVIGMIAATVFLAWAGRRVSAAWPAAAPVAAVAAVAAPERRKVPAAPRRSPRPPEVAAAVSKSA